LSDFHHPALTNKPVKTYKIKKTAGLSPAQFYDQLSKGGKIVTYGYCISIVAMTFRLTSSPYFIGPGEKLSQYRLRYNLRSLLFGWWGLPWGPIYTIDMIKINFKDGGGIDVTNDLISKIKEKYPERNNRTALTGDLTVEFNINELTH
jgi:hypothetical protein